MKDRPKDNVHAGDTQASLCIQKGSMGIVRVYACERKNVCDKG